MIVEMINVGHTNCLAKIMKYTLYTCMLLPHLISGISNGHKRDHLISNCSSPTRLAGPLSSLVPTTFVVTN